MITKTNPETSPAQLQQWEEEFEAAARRPLTQRMRYAFIKTYKPVLDDAPFRAWDTMEEHRAWCEENLPDWLGYDRDGIDHKRYHEKPVLRVQFEHGLS